MANWQLSDGSKTFKSRDEGRAWVANRYEPYAQGRPTVVRCGEVRAEIVMRPLEPAGEPFTEPQTALQAEQALLTRCILALSDIQAISTNSVIRGICQDILNMRQE